MDVARRLIMTAFMLLLDNSSGYEGLKNDDPPKWPDSYAVTGVVHVPYAEIEEPFMAWYSSKIKKSRIDYYDVVKTYQFPNVKGHNDDYGQVFKVIPVALDGLNSKESCVVVNGTKDAPVALQSVLPDLTGFKKAENVVVNGKSCTVWRNETVIGARKNEYVMYIGDDNVPVQYEMFGYDSLLGSHYDKYYLVYENLISNNISDDIFKVNTSLKCVSFPGPGHFESRILMNPMQEYIDEKDEHIPEMFVKYKLKHKKSYKHSHHHQLRENNFRHNIRFIQSRNRAGLSYQLAVNHLADRSATEMKVLRGRRYTPGHNGGRPFDLKDYIMKFKKGMPDQLDWRLYGAVTPVKDQAICGSCWSFGTTGTLEGAHFLKTGRLVRLSQQELIDCSWEEGNNGCDGGEDFRAYQWMMKHGGLAAEYEYGQGQYFAQDLNCGAKNSTPVAKIRGYVNVTSGDSEALKMALIAHGPISVGIDASHRSLSFYSNGIYYEEKCGSKPEELDHAVLAVGYGVLNGQTYWLIKNSWSTYWGNDGYVLMSQKNNNCGVTTSPTFVIM